MPPEPVPSLGCAARWPPETYPGEGEIFIEPDATVPETTER
jgi:hypothetical protein